MCGLIGHGDHLPDTRASDSRLVDEQPLRIHSLSAPVLGGRRQRRRPISVADSVRSGRSLQRKPESTPRLRSQHGRSRNIP